MFFSSPIPDVLHAENISYFGERLPGSGRTDEAQLVYQFPLAPLTLHAFLTGDATRLTDWLSRRRRPGLFFNFIASHDGIGLMPAAGLLEPRRFRRWVNRTLAYGGRVSYKSGAGGDPIPYELNISRDDALNHPDEPDPERDLRRFIGSQVILLLARGTARASMFTACSARATACLCR